MAADDGQVTIQITASSRFREALQSENGVTVTSVTAVGDMRQPLALATIVTIVALVKSVADILEVLCRFYEKLKAKNEAPERITITLENGDQFVVSNLADATLLCRKIRSHEI